MFGRQELNKLRAQKQALLLESTLNRHALHEEWQELRSAASWMSNAAHGPGRFVLLLAMLAPLAGFLVVRGLRRPESLFTRLVSAAKWIGPIYSLWRGYSAARKKGTETVAPAG